MGRPGGPRAPGTAPGVALGVAPALLAPSQSTRYSSSGPIMDMMSMFFLATLEYLRSMGSV